jgi:CRP/FNR family cyclic AMP-dependent transcriptional regulator
MDRDLLRRIDLFANLEPLHLSHLASIAVERKVARGTVLFDEGDNGSELFVVGQGKVRISKMIPGIGEEALAILGPGAYFGEMEYLDRELPRAARVTIHESATLHCFGFQELDDLMSADRDFALAICMSMLKTFSRRLRDTNDKVSAMFAMAKF